MEDSLVEIYQIEENGSRTLLQTTRTDQEGRYSISYTNRGLPLELIASGGSFEDEATGQTLNLDQPLKTALSGAQTRIEINSLTSMAWAASIGRGIYTSSGIQNASSSIAAMIGRTSLHDSEPKNPASTQENSGDPAYGLALAGVSQLSRTLGINPNAAINLLIQDSMDGKLDGLAGTSVLTAAGIQLRQNWATQELATSIESFATSTRNLAQVTLPLEITQSLRSFNGGVDASRVLSVAALPSRASTQIIRISGNTSPGSRRVSLFRNGSLSQSLISSTTGLFATDLSLSTEGENRIRILLDGSNISKEFLIIRDTQGPSITSSPALPGLTRALSLSFQLLSTDALGPSRLLTATASSGQLVCTTGFSCTLSQFPDGLIEILADATDELNSSRISFRFYADRTQPTFSATPVSPASSSYRLPLSFSEPLTSLRYRLYPLASPGLGSTSIPPQSTFLDLNLNQEGTWYFDLSGEDEAGNPLRCPGFIQLASNTTDLCETNLILDKTRPTVLSGFNLPQTSTTLGFPLSLQFSENSTVVARLSAGGSLFVTHAYGQNCSIDHGTGSGCHLEFPALASLMDNQIQLQLELIDRAQNLTTTSAIVLLDRIPPGRVTGVPSSLRTSSMTWPLALQGENLARIELNSSLVGSTRNGTYTTTLNLNPNQINTFRIRQIDPAGNPSPLHHLNIEQDSTPPGLNLSASHPLTAWLTTSDSIQIHLQASESLSQASVRLGTSTTGFSLTSRTGTAILAISRVSLETTAPLIQVSASDLLGNTTSENLILSTGIDTLAPRISDVSVLPASGSVGIGQAITFSLTLENSDFQPQASFWRKFPSGAFTTSPLNTMSLNDLSLTTSFILEENDAGHGHPVQGLINVTDQAGNTSSTDFTGQAILDARRPRILQISNNLSSSGVLGVGKSIEFVLSLASEEPDLIVSATWFNRPLTFSPQSGGLFYKAQTTVEATDTSGHAPSIILTARDLAGNAAIPPLSSAILPIVHTIDAVAPAISLASVTPQTIATILIPDHKIRFFVTVDPSREATSPSTVSAFASWRSSIFSLPPLTNRTSFELLRNIDANSGDASANSTWQIWLEDLGGNRSAPQSGRITPIVDASLPAAVSVTASNLSRTGAAIIHDTLQIGLATSPFAGNYTASASLNLGTGTIPLLFQSQGDVLATTISLPSGSMETGSLILEQIEIHKPSGARSLPQTLSFSLLIDNQAPQIASAVLSSALTTARVGTLISASIFPRIAQTGISGSLSMFGSTYPLSAVSSGQLVTSFPLPAISGSGGPLSTQAQVMLKDIAGNSSEPVTVPATGFLSDTGIPVLTGLTAIPSVAATWLGLSDSLMISLFPASFSTDVTSGQAFLSGTTLSFDASLSLSLPLSQVPDAFLSSPVLSGIVLTDGAGNTSQVSSKTLTGLNLDTIKPRLLSLSAIASRFPTMRIGDSVELSFTVSEAMPATATAAYGGLTFPLVLSGNTYSGTYTLLSTHPSVTTPVLSLNLSDEARNLSTWTTQLPAVSFDTDAPEIQSFNLNSNSSSQLATLLRIGDQILLSVSLSQASTSGGTNPASLVEGNCLNRSTSFSPDTSGLVYTANLSILATDGFTSGPLICSALARDLAGNPSATVTAALAKGVDAQSPLIERIEHSASGTRIASGQMVHFRIVPSSASLADSTAVSSFFNGESLNFVRQSTDGTFLATYTMLPGKPEHPITPIQLEARLNDLVGNQGPLFTTTNLPYLFKATPSTLSLSHNHTTAGRLGVFNLENTTNSSILFELSVSPPDKSLSVVSTIMGTVPLSFSSNQDGSLYTANYLVSPVHPYSQSSAPVNITATDSFGNTTSLMDTSLAKAIDPVAPILTQASMRLLQATPVQSGWVKIGDSVEFELVANAACIATTCSQDPPVTVSALFAGTSLSFLSTDSLHWITTFTLDADRTTLAPGLNQLTSIKGYDQAGNSASIPGFIVMTAALDARRPTIQSLSVSSTSPVSVLTVGDYIEFMLVSNMLAPSGTERFGWATATYNGASLNFTEESSSGVYLSTYTVATTHTDQNQPLQLADVYFYDQAGNRSLLPATTVAGLNGVSLPIDLGPPIVLSLSATPSSSRTTLKMGDSVAFSLILSKAEENLSFTSAAYNGVALSFTSTNGTHYLATYILDNGHMNQLSSPVQLALTMSDAASQTATAATTSIGFLLDPNPPSITSFDFANPLAESVGLGQHVTFSLISQAAEPGATVMKVSSGVTSILTFAGKELHFTSTDGLQFTTHYTVKNGDNLAGFFSLNQVSLIDAAGNQSPLNATQTVYKSLDGTLPATPSIFPRLLTTTNLSASLNLSGQGDTELWLNGAKITDLPSSGQYVYTTSLVSGSLTSLSFQIREASGNRSPLQTAWLLSTPKAILNNHSGLWNNTHAGLNRIYPNPFLDSSLYICGRFGLARLNLNPNFEASTDSYTSLQSGLEAICPEQLVSAGLEGPLLALQNGRIYRKEPSATNFTQLPLSAHGNRSVNALLFPTSHASRAYAATTETLRGSASSGLSFSDNLNANGPLPVTTEKLYHQTLAYAGNRIYTGTKGGLFFTDLSGTFGSWNLAGAGSAIPTTSATDLISLAATQNLSALIAITSQNKLLITSNLSAETDTIKPAFHAPVASEISHASLFSHGLILAASGSQILSLPNYGSAAQTIWQSFGTNLVGIAAAQQETRAFMATDSHLYASSDLMGTSTSLSDLTSALPPLVSRMALGNQTAYFLSAGSLMSLTYGQMISQASLIQSTQTSFTAITLRPSDSRIFFANSTGLLSIDASGGSTLTPALPSPRITSPPCTPLQPLPMSSLPDTIRDSS